MTKYYIDKNLLWLLNIEFHIKRLKMQTLSGMFYKGEILTIILENCIGILILYFFNEKVIMPVKQEAISHNQEVPMFSCVP